MICSSLTAFSPPYDGLFYCSMSTITRHMQIININLWLRHWEVCANMSFIDGNQTLTIDASPTGRKPGGASDGEEPEPDGREAQSLSQHDAGSSKSDPGADHSDTLSVRETIQIIGRREGQLKRFLLRALLWAFLRRIYEGRN